MRLVIALVVATAFVAIGCDSKLKVESDSGKPVSVTVSDAIGVSTSVSISEMCYDHVTYLINAKGGMAPKIASQSTGFAVSPYIKC